MCFRYLVTETRRREIKHHCRDFLGNDRGPHVTQKLSWLGTIERYLLIMLFSFHCARPVMECLPLAFQSRQQIKAMNDGPLCAAGSFDAFPPFWKWHLYPAPRILLHCDFSLRLVRFFNLYACAPLIYQENKTQWIWKSSWQKSQTSSRRPICFHRMTSFTTVPKRIYQDQFHYAVNTSTASLKTIQGQQFGGSTSPDTTTSTKSSASEWINRAYLPF